MIGLSTNGIAMVRRTASVSEALFVRLTNSEKQARCLFGCLSNKQTGNSQTVGWESRLI